MMNPNGNIEINIKRQVPKGAMRNMKKGVRIWCLIVILAVLGSALSGVAGVAKKPIEKLKRPWDWFIKKCKEYGWWIIIAAIAIVSFIVLCLFRPNTDVDSARYILSVISKEFIAIFVLVFTIPLIIAQLTGSYAIILKKGKELLFLIILSVIGIIIPLIILDFGFWCIWINGAIAFSIFCIAALLHLFVGIITDVKYAWIEKLPEEIEEAIDSKNTPRAFRKIEELGILGKDTAKRGEENQVKYAIRGLRQAGLKAIGRGKEFWDIASASVNELREVGVEAARKKLDAQRERGEYSGITGGSDLALLFSATALALKGLEEVGTKAAEADMGAVTYSSINFLADVGIAAMAAMEKGLTQDTIDEAVHGLKEVGKKSAEKGLKYHGNYFVIVQAVKKLIEFGNEAVKHKHETKLIVNVLWVLGAAATKSSADLDIDISTQMIDQLERSKRSEGETIIDLFEAGFDSGRGYTDEKYPYLVPSLEEFKRRYEER